MPCLACINIFLNCSNFCPCVGACTFDQSNLCTWTNVQSGDQFDWTLQKKGTPSSGTGPATDHTQGNTNGDVFVWIKKHLIEHILFITIIWYRIPKNKLESKMIVTNV